MGDFGTAVRYLDWVKSRQASLLESQSAPVPFSKYYGLQRSRVFKKIPYVLIVPKHLISDNIDTYQYLPRLVFQYNITLPFSSAVIRVEDLNTAVLPGVITIKWVDINTGAVTRYGIKNGSIHRFKLCDVYTNQRIPSKFSIEFWLGTIFFGNCGIKNDFKLILSPITNPLFPEELERDITIDGPHDFPEFSWNTPFIVPQINNIVPWPLPDLTISNLYLIDNLGNFILDDLGNRILLTL